MGDDDTTLSDDEIDALLEDDDLDEETEEPASEPAEAEEPAGPDQDLIRSQYEDLNESIGTVLETILTVDAAQTIKSCGVIESPELQQEFQTMEGNLVLVESDVDGAVNGVTRYVLPEGDALILADIMMGQEGDDPPEELDDAYKSALGEMYNQILNTVFNNVGDLSGETINASAPEISVVQPNEMAGILEEDEYLRTSYEMQIGDLIDGSLFFELQPVELGEILESAVEPDEEPAEEPAPEPESEPAAAPTGGQQQQSQSTGGEEAEVKDVQFPQFDATEGEAGEGNLNMLMDVPMQVAVELGRTKLQVKEILNLGQGSIIELDRLAGEPVDLLVNGRLVARGEVVVIDESFGVRVTSIVSPMERIKQ